MTSLRLIARGGARGLATSVRETPPAAVTTRAEQLMQRAMAEGHFENLAGAGKPLPARGAEAPRVRLSGAQLLSQRAESEMRRCERAGELDGLAGAGAPLGYRGTMTVAAGGAHIARYAKENAGATSAADLGA